ncbi:MAG: TolC family protein [Deltaproteobacteria bacterium]|nr:TolC family protein [Deltaproteobacteria bacterium]
MQRFKSGAASAAMLLVLFLEGCVLAPRGTDEERARVARAGAAWVAPAQDRALPELPAEPAWSDVLRRAFLANGDLEAAYLDWRAAVERIDVAAGYPNTNVALGYQYLFSGDDLKGWDRSTFTIGSDPMQNLSFPTKVMAAGREALAEARAAGERFGAARLELQQRVLTAWWEYALLAERIRIEREALALVGLSAAGARARLGAGASARELLALEVERRLAEDGVRRLEADVIAHRARLNALLARPAGEPLALPSRLPEPRALLIGDRELLATAAARNPALAALDREIEARTGGVERAYQEFIPDVNPFAGFTGGIEQIAGVMASLPARVPILLGMVREARTRLARAEATHRQASSDTEAAVLATLAALRDRERQMALLEGEVRPLADRAAANARAAYESGALDVGELIEAEQLVLEIDLLEAEARTAREIRLAELEALIGFDVETVARADAATAKAAAGAPGRSS